MVRTVTASRRTPRPLGVAVLATLVACQFPRMLAAQAPVRTSDPWTLSHEDAPLVPLPAHLAVAGGDMAKPLWPTSQLAIAGSLAIGALAIAPFDGRWTRALQSPRYQDNMALHRGAVTLRRLGDPGALLLSASVYAAGRLARRDGLADAGWHATEAVMAGGLTTLALKAIVGRQRPYAAQGTDADEFRFGRGYRSDYASMPSGHTTVAFAAAAAFGAELSRSHHAAARVVTPLLYTTAAGVGASRLYNNKHWASDVLIAAGIGHAVGRTLVAIAHRGQRH